MAKSNRPWERWELANFDQAGKPMRVKPLTQPTGPAAGTAPSSTQMPTTAEIDAAYQEARKQGFQAGHAEGLLAGETAARQAVEQQVQLLAQALSRFEQSLASFDEQIAQDLLLLAQEIARQIVRRSIELQPESVLAVINEALQLMPHQYANIYLHPDDAALVRSADGMHLTHAGHRIHEDENLSRGDCVLESGNSRVDATLATRWKRVVAGLGSVEPLDKSDDETS